MGYYAIIKKCQPPKELTPKKVYKINYLLRKSKYIISHIYIYICGISHF